MPDWPSLVHNCSDFVCNCFGYGLNVLYTCVCTNKGCMCLQCSSSGTWAFVELSPSSPVCCLYVIAFKGNENFVLDFVVFVSREVSCFDFSSLWETLLKTQNTRRLKVLHHEFWLIYITQFQIKRLNHAVWKYAKRLSNVDADKEWLAL